MEVIHCKLSKEKLHEYGVKIGELVKPDMTARRYDHACSWMIELKILEELGEIALLTKNTYSEIIGSFTLMTRWVNHAKLVKCLITALEHWLNPTASVVFDEYYLKTDIENYPMKIHEDISVFVAWAIYRGADSSSIRRELPSRIQQNVQTIIKKIGDDGIVSMLWRSLVAYMSITEKAIEPKYRESFKHGVKESTAINSMASAFQSLKKEVA